MHAIACMMHTQLQLLSIHSTNADLLEVLLSVPDVQKNDVTIKFLSGLRVQPEKCLTIHCLRRCHQRTQSLDLIRSHVMEACLWFAFQLRWAYPVTERIYAKYATSNTAVHTCILCMPTWC
jgi:hypothetical protein